MIRTDDPFLHLKQVCVGIQRENSGRDYGKSDPCYLYMSITINQTHTFGIQEGAPFDDLKEVGEWPDKQLIKGIKQIRLAHDWLVDGMEITYELKSGPTTTQTVNHLGGEPFNGNPVDFGPNEVLLGVTGMEGIPGYYQNKPYLCALRFVIADTKTGEVRVAGPYGYNAPAGTYTGPAFTVSGPLIALAGSVKTGGTSPATAISVSFFRTEVPGVTFPIVPA